MNKYLRIILTALLAVVPLCFIDGIDGVNDDSQIARGGGFRAGGGRARPAAREGARGRGVAGRPLQRTPALSRAAVAGRGYVAGANTAASYSGGGYAYPSQPYYPAQYTPPSDSQYTPSNTQNSSSPQYFPAS